MYPVCIGEHFMTCDGFFVWTRQFSVFILYMLKATEFITAVSTYRCKVATVDSFLTVYLFVDITHMQVIGCVGRLRNDLYSYTVSGGALNSTQPTNYSYAKMPDSVDLWCLS